LRSEATDGLVRLRSTWLRKLGVKPERAATSLSDRLRSSRSRRIVAPRSGSLDAPPVVSVHPVTPRAAGFSCPSFAFK